MKPSDSRKQLQPSDQAFYLLEEKVMELCIPKVIEGYKRAQKEGQLRFGLPGLYSDPPEREFRTWF
jgi:hypothetical protein